MANQEYNNNLYEMSQAVKDATMYRMVYPDVYYMVKPYVMMMCDQMDAYGTDTLTHEMVEQMTTTIYDDVCRMHPDMMECSPDLETINSPFNNPLGYGRGRQQGNMFRDLITILFLSEIFGRRRRFY